MDFVSRLNQEIKTKKTIAVVGLDPRWELIPSEFKKSLNAAGAYVLFCQEVIHLIKDIVPAIKIQAAFFEVLGTDGMYAIKEVISYAKDHGLLIILDVKRGDIGSTAQAYAKAYLGDEETWGQIDAITVNPYLGEEGLRPFVTEAKMHHKGIFVLVRTSNPSAEAIQGNITNNKSASAVICNIIRRYEDSEEWSHIGAVAGATHPKELPTIRTLLPNSILLLPGYGAQGATSEDLAPALYDDGLGAIVNSSRGIIFPKSSGRPWRTEIRLAAERMVNDLSDHTPAGNL